MTLHLRSSLGWLVLLALGTSLLPGQESQLPVSRTAAALNVALPKDKSTLLALPLVRIKASGTVSAVNGNEVTLVSSPSALPALTATPHAIKITSRVDQRGTGANAPAGASTNAYGIAARITAQSSQTVTAALSIAPNVGDEFVIYELSTLASVFGAANTIGLNGAATPDAADIVYLGSGGDLVGYFYSTTANGWRAVATPAGADQGDAVIEPSAAVLVVRRNAGEDVTLLQSGQLLPGRQVAPVTAGFQVINNPFTVSTTLAASGLQGYVTGGTGPGNADLLYLEDGGALIGYYYKTGGVGGTGWRSLADPLSNQGAVLVKPGKAILFKEQAGNAGFALQEPFAE